MTDVAPALFATHPLVAGLTETHVAAMRACARAGRWPAGAWILREGEPADALYLLTSGTVSLEVHRLTGGAVQLETVGSGALLGFGWLVPPRRWHLDARAREPVEAWVVDAVELRAAMDRDAAFGYAVTTRVAAALYERLERVRLQRLDVFRAVGP